MIARHKPSENSKGTNKRPHSGAQLSDLERCGAESVRQVVRPKVHKQSVSQVRAKAGLQVGIGPALQGGGLEESEGCRPGPCLRLCNLLICRRVSMVGRLVGLESCLHSAHQDLGPVQGCNCPQRGAPFLVHKKAACGQHWLWKHNILNT